MTIRGMVTAFIYGVGLMTAVAVAVCALAGFRSDSDE
jgi:hypothetical protein